MPEYDVGFGPLRGPSDGGRGQAETADTSLDVPNLQLSVSYIKDPKHGQQTAVVTATWDAPTAGEDLGGTARNLVTGYWVSDRQGTAAQPDLSWSAERKTTERKVVFRGLNLQTLMDFRVRARKGDGVYGPYAQKSVNTAQDTTAPERPSKATLEAALRGVIIKWDGKTFSGGEQPNDYARTEVEVSIDGGAYARVTEFGRGGGSYYYNTPNTSSRIYRARLRSFDFVGNASLYTETDSKASFDFTAAGAAAGGDNLVKNASFEDFRDPVSATPKDWAVWGAGFTQAQDNQQSFHGAFSQRVGNASGAGGYQQTVPCLPDKRYFVSAYIRPEGTRRGSPPDGFLLSATEDTGAVHRVGGYAGLTADRWTRVFFDFTTGPNTRSLTIRTHHVSDGFMFVDAVQLDADTITPFSPRAGEIGRITVSMADIRDLLITSDLLKDGAVQGRHVREGAITAAKTALAAVDPNSGTLAINSVVANNIVGGTITGLKMFAETINSRELASDSVTGAKILAGSVTASKLTIGRLGDNLVLNGGFESDFDGWVGDGPGFRTIEPASTTAGTSGTKHAQLTTGAGTTRIVQQVAAPAIGGKFYYMSALLGSTGPDSYGGVFWYRADGSYIGFSQAWNLRPQSPAKVVDGQVKAPNDAARGAAVVHAYGSAGGALVVDEVNLREVIGTTQIMDGLITTDKVSAMGISADRIAAGSINARISIQSPVINSGELYSGLVDAGNIRGGTITGSSISTGFSGQNRVVMFDGGAKDVISFVTNVPGQGERITGDLRGGGLPNGFYHGSQTYGLYVNSTVQLGNEQSIIHQVGKRATRGGADSRVRVRADHVLVTLSEGRARVGFGTPMTQAPTFVLATLSDFTDGRPAIHRVYDYTANDFGIDVFVQGSDGRFGRPGGTPQVYVSFYCEIVV